MLTQKENSVYSINKILAIIFWFMLFLELLRISSIACYFFLFSKGVLTEISMRKEVEEAFIRAETKFCTSGKARKG
jgi:hypothetical protein